MQRKGRLIAFAFLLAPTLACSEAGDDGGGSLTRLVPEISVDPIAVDFGSVQLQATVTRRVLVHNTGDGDLEVDIAAAAGFEATPFSLPVREGTAFPSRPIAIDVAFTPTELESYQAAFVVTPRDETLDPVTVTVEGRGASTFEVSAESLDFGNVLVGTTKALALTLQNRSDVDSNIEYVAGANVARCGQDGASDKFCVRLRDRSFGPDSRFRLRAGETTTLEVEFSPTIEERDRRVFPANGEFTLRACESDACAVTIGVAGKGVRQNLECTPPRVDFGHVNPGACFEATVACRNIANDRVTVLGWEARAPTSTAYRIEASAVTVIDEGDAMSIDVAYCPASLDRDEGTLAIETNHPDANERWVLVSLTGTGGGPDIAVLPSTLQFGLVSLVAPSRRSLVIQNIGYAPLEILEVSVDPAGANVFSTPNLSLGAIEPGGFLDVTVEFEPLIDGAIASELVIRSDDQDEPTLRVPLFGNGVNLPPCDFEIVPERLPFGFVERTRLASRAVEIRNLGSGDCLVSSARLLGDSDPAFSLPDGDVSGIIIAPDASATVRVEFAPTAARTSTGAIELSISSPTTPFNVIPLHGVGADATLLIVPNELDFGTIGVGCASRSRDVTVYNTGSTPAVLESIEMAAPANPAFEITALPTPLNGAPLTLGPGQATNFEVRFHAAGVASHAGAVELRGTFAGETVDYLIGLSGAGSVDATQVDEFEQLGRPKVDILFVVDSSGSMSEEQTSLGDNFEAFVEFADAQHLDYQLGVTTTDVDPSGERGRLIPLSGSRPSSDRIVTPNTVPSPSYVFGQNVNVGTSGSADEQGLEAAYLALSAPLSFTENAGFLRQDATLSIILVSDEEDQSPQPVDFYVNFFKSIKGFRNTNLFSASAIAGPGPNGCDGSSGSADAGLRYFDVANRTGGIFQSICTSDWSRALEDLSTTAFGFKSRFFLSNQPVLSSLRVFIDGAASPATTAEGTVNWTYEPATNTVNFTTFSTPEPGARIRIEYTAECL